MYVYSVKNGSRRAEKYKKGSDENYLGYLPLSSR